MNLSQLTGGADGKVGASRDGQGAQRSSQDRDLTSLRLTRTSICDMKAGIAWGGEVVSSSGGLWSPKNMATSASLPVIAC